VFYVWVIFNETFKSRFLRPFPARSSVGAGLLGFLVEISVIAYVPG
jgi:hypothetical protein